MKRLFGICVAAVILLGAAASGPAAASVPAAVSVAKTASVETVPTDVKLNTAQLANFVTAYCLNVATRGTSATRTLFEQVAEQDQIPASQVTYIETLAAVTC